MTVEQSAKAPEWDSTEPASVRAWLFAAGRGLVDLRFHRTATQVLVPLVYLGGLFTAAAVPTVAVVTLWQWSAVAGAAFAIAGALPLGVMLAAVVRLLLEFLVHTARLSQRAGHITSLADELHSALTEVTVPMTQLSRDLRAVQFWRLGRR